MPTLDTEFRAPNKLPDIFRTINGINIDIGPFDRLRDLDLQQKPAQPGTSVRVQENAVPSDRKQFPRIILRDALGYELDTFTALQEAIYRAKWNVKQSGLAKEPLEWRLPKAPPPARPDLTRTCPPPKHPPVHHTDDRIRSRWEHSRVLEFDVEDVGFVRESLQYLPYAPSLSFLRQEILVGPKTYFQIVGTMLLHRKILSQTEKRHAIYNFPGFCTGCTRMGLCYGCERGTELHFHEDKPVKTGGGFTYFKKDRPENEIKSRNPVNWRIQQPDKALKKLMEEYTGVELEGPLPDEIKKLLDKHGGHRERIVSNIPDFAREMQEMAKKENKSRDRSLPEIHVRYKSQEDFDDDLENQSRGQSQGHYEGQLNPDDVRISMKGEDDMLGDEEYGDYMYQDQHGFAAGIDEDDQSRGDKGLSPNQTWPGGRNLKARYPATEGQRGGASDEEGHWLPVSEQLESDEENAGDEETDTEPYGQRRSRRKERLYKAPPPFKLKKSPKRSTVSRSPFSTERSYDLPKGKGFQVKKSDKPLTEFREFRNVDVSWKEPKKFELKKTEQKTTKFWSGPPKKKAEKTEKRERGQDQDGHGRRRAPSPRSLSPDSGHDSEFHTDTTAKSELEPVREESVTVTPEPNMGLSERTGTPLQLRVTSPADKAEPVPVSPVPKKKREIIKKEKKVRTPVPPLVPVEEPKPPTPVAREKTPSPAPSEERPASRELSFDFVKEPSIPELPPIEVPALPEIPERQSEYKGVKKERKLIEVTPELPEPKKKLPPPPKLAPRIKTRSTRRSKIPAEAPVTAQELQQLADPLDFLAKYCIINPDRLPFYERVFNGAVNIQTPRYSKDNIMSRGEIVHLPPAQLSEHELNMLRDLTVITHAQSPRREGLSVPEQYMEKLNYTIEFVKMKQMELQQHMHKVQVEKMKLMAKMAKEMDRDIVRVDYKTKKSKKKKKKKKKKSDEPDYDSMGAMSVPKNFRPQRASDITDEVIVSRMDDKMLKKVKKDPEIKKYTLEISRDIEKLKAFDQRIAQIEDEKDLVGIYCMDYYFSEQNGTAAPHEFRRQQSRLYQKLHPDLDIEMNVEEVETALQQVNNKLLTEKEFQYIFFILDLPKRQKINFRLFSIIAALSEKVTQMDPVIRKLLNKVDYNALDVKMEKSKELFELLQDETMPVGNAPADVLAVELTAGGLTPEHTNYVLSKFDREGRGLVDFLDFVTYIPLFIEIHKRIIEDPFNESLDV